MRTEPVRVLLVDDHPVVRAGIRGELEKAEDITVIGEASTGEEGLRLADELAPDLVLLDMALPDLDGVEVTHRLREAHPERRVLVFSGYADDAFVFGALEAGAVGYLLKDEMLERLADAVQAAVRGETVLSERVTRKAIRRATGKTTEEQGWSSLSERELQVLNLVAFFRTNDEIAAELGISTKTVEYHLANILAKLDKGSRREAARWAWDQGLIGA
jgi:NarL family two-component system response regulator LiaR